MRGVSEELSIFALSISLICFVMEKFNLYFKDVILKQYAQFQGKTPRAGFWYYVLFYLICDVILGIIDSILGWNGLLPGILDLAILVPTLAIGARRLHDIGKSGWWWLIGLVPVVGWIVLIYFWVQKSK
ncbi:MAG: DUF805 domain-containing protein [Bacteroidales bacterium]|nr:DUF805 domain-containing protein [Bacteroidales bacterium]